MAKEWYLLSPSTKPNSIGGYENESFRDYKDDAFSEALETDIATTVILYNYDLSESQEIRCIIQGNTADTQLKSMERIGLFYPNTVKAGMHIFFEGRYWLIDGYPGTQGIYEKATMCLCQYKLRWQNNNGDILQRWCNITSASKYDVGVSGNNTIILTSNNYTIKMAYDKDALELEEKRVFIDKKIINPTKVFKLTRSDDVLYDYGENHGSILSFIADKVELDPEKDNQELRICDYHSPTHDNISDSDEEIMVSIEGGNVIRYEKRKKWTAVIKDKDGNIINPSNIAWKIESDFVDKIVQKINGNQIELLINEENCIGNSFLLKFYLNNTIKQKIQIDIVEGF